jgi:hypothetical protein
MLSSIGGLLGSTTREALFTFDAYIVPGTTKIYGLKRGRRGDRFVGRLERPHGRRGQSSSSNHPPYHAYLGAADERATGGRGRGLRIGRAHMEDYIALSVNARLQQQAP